MKKLDLSNIVAGVRKLGATKSTFEHMQEAYSDITSAALLSLLSQASGVNVLHGCVNSGSGADYNISAGAVYYAGEVFEVAAFVGTAGGGQVPVISIATAYRAGDPVKYSDNNNYNTHSIRTMTWAFGAPGSGLSDFSALVRAFKLKGTLEIEGGIRTINSGPYLKRKVIEIGDWNMDTTSTKAVAHGLSDITKIRAVNVVIRKDDSTEVYPLVRSNTSGVHNGGWIDSIGVANVNLTRIDSATNGLFDHTDFDLTPFNRGWVTIDYEA